MDRHRFDQAIGTSPPSTVDIDAVVARQRRALLLRRVAGPAAAAAATVVAVTFGVALALPHDAGTSPAAPPAIATSPAIPTSPDASSTPPPTSPGLPIPTPIGPAPRSDGADPPATTPRPCVTPPNSGDLAATADRLTAAARAAVTAHAPGVTLSASPGGGRHGPLEFLHVPDPSDCAYPHGYLISYATVTDPTGVGELMILAGHGGVGVATDCGTPLPSRSPSHEGGTCTRETGPHGETILSSTETLLDGPTVHRLDVTRPDGTQLILQSQNGHGKSGPTTRPTPNLSFAQLTAIALDPALTVTPP